MTNCIRCYKDGVGVAINLQEAAHWFERSADRGYAGGQFELGESFRLGLGVGRNSTLAVQWYRRAASQ